MVEDEILNNFLSFNKNQFKVFLILLYHTDLHLINVLLGGLN